MELTNEFEVEASIDKVWQLLTDVERIAPCIPGFELKEIVGEEYRGTMSVKVGAVGMKYDCKVAFVERDDAGYRAVMSAAGRDTRGQGGLTSTITSTLTTDGVRTKAAVVTDLMVTGRIGQFGRSILAEVSNRLVGQFVSCLESKLLEADAPAGGAGAGVDADVVPATDGAERRSVSHASAQPVDLLAVTGKPLLKLLTPLLGVVALVMMVIRRRRS